MDKHTQQIKPSKQEGSKWMGESLSDGGARVAGSCNGVYMVESLI